jgi:hypothetical protein
LNNEIEIVLESSTKYFSPARKILEKNITDKQKQVFKVIAYAIDFNSKELKKKESKDGKTCFVKISLTQEKNKYESQIKISLNMDSILPHVKFEPMKKLFGKEAAPPEQLVLTTLQVMQIFTEVLSVYEKRDINYPTYIALKIYGIRSLNNMKTYDMALYYLLYADIINGQNADLIKQIFAAFNDRKVIKPLNPKDLLPLTEKMEQTYKNQTSIFEFLQKSLGDIHPYLIKFYTIHIFLYSTLENYETCERILQDLNNNPYDNLLLSKLFLSEYSNIYRNIPISDQIKNSLITNNINSADNYKKLLTAFIIIKEYIKKDFVKMLSIVVDNYDKINEVCYKSESVLNINDFIEQKEDDDLSKAQYYLDIITQKKLNYKYKCINFDLKMWDFYFSDLSKNKNFWEFFKSNLINSSVSYNELKESLNYIMNYYSKDFVIFLELVVTNYDKIKEITKNTKLPLYVKDFVVQNKNNDIEKMKEHLNFILPNKLKDQFEIVLFDVNLWNFYIFNQFNMNFLTYLEKQLYATAICHKDIGDCLEYSSNLRNKSFISMLEIINYNFQVIQDISRKDNIRFSIEEYISPRPGSDDMFKIYDLLKTIIEKELVYNFPSITFPVNLWATYSETDSLENLRFIRKVILETKKIEPELNEDTIGLTKKIHDISYMEIKNGTLQGEKLLAYLGDEELYYRDRVSNELNKRLVEHQEQLNSHANVINDLNREHSNLVNVVNDLSRKVATLMGENIAYKTRITNLERENSRLNGEIGSLSRDLSNLRRRVNYMG